MEIKINNNTYKICEVEFNDEKLKMEDGNYHFGITDFNKKEIYIANNLNEDAKRYTTLHELTHALIDSYGFLQVDWNDEIVADFIGNYFLNICDILNEISVKRKKNESK